MTMNQEVALFFGAFCGGALCAWLWVRWAMKRDAAKDAAECARRVQPVFPPHAPEAEALSSQEMYSAWREARLRFMRENPATAQALGLKAPPDDKAMWPEHFLEAKKCLAMYEQAMNNREWDLAQEQAANLRRLGAMMLSDADREKEHANKQG